MKILFSVYLTFLLKMSSFSGAWRVDNPSNEQLLVNGNTVTHVGKKGKSNAIYLGASGAGYYEFEVRGSSGLWIGITSEDKFGEGYKTKGLFFGGPGNLADGSGLIIGEWGPAIADNDLIGMLIELENQNLKIAFSKNGFGLGVAYFISDWTIAPFHPAVSLESEGQSVTIKCLTENLPDMTKFLPSHIPAPGLEGKWKGNNYHVSIKQMSANEYRLHAKVSNRIGCAFKLNPSDNTVTWVSPVSSTLMFPDPSMNELEVEVTNLLKSLKAVKREGDRLVIEGGELSGDMKHHVFEADLVPPIATRDLIQWLLH